MNFDLRLLQRHPEGAYPASVEHKGSHPYGVISGDGEEEGGLERPLVPSISPSNFVSWMNFHINIIYHLGNCGPLHRSQF